MDEEDLAELRDSRQLVDENDEMDFVRGGTASELRRRTGADGEQEEEEYVLPHQKCDTRRGNDKTETCYIAL